MASSDNETGTSQAGSIMSVEDEPQSSQEEDTLEVQTEETPVVETESTTEVETEDTLMVMEGKKKTAVVEIECTTEVETEVPEETAVVEIEIPTEVEIEATLIVMAETDEAAMVEIEATVMFIVETEDTTAVAADETAVLQIEGTTEVETETAVVETETAVVETEKTAVAETEETAEVEIEDTADAETEDTPMVMVDTEQAPVIEEAEDTTEVEIKKTPVIGADDTTELETETEEQRTEARFEEVTVGGIEYCLVPKSMASYVPTVQPTIQYLEGIGPVEVGNNYLYIPSNLLSLAMKMIDNSIDLQAEVECCRSFLWAKYGSSKVPPFDPDSMKKVCELAGARKLFPTIMSAMSTICQSSNKQESNEKKCVSIIYMLIFGQSQKANWFQKVLSTQVVGKGISDTGLSILNNSGIAISRNTQKLDRQRSARNHSQVVRDFISDAVSKQDLLVLMIDDFTNIHTKSMSSPCCVCESLSFRRCWKTEYAKNSNCKDFLDVYKTKL